MGSKAPTIRWTKQITPSQVHQLIRAERDVRKALLLFDSATAEYPNGFRHDHSTFALIISRLSSANLLGPAELLLTRIHDELGEPPSEPVFLSVIRSYGRAHKPLDALRLFRQMKDSFHLEPTHRSYTAVFAILVAENQLKLARRFYNHMRQMGIPPSVASFNVLIKALCGGGGTVEAALRVFGQMADRGCPPDSCTYNTLIDGLCKLGRIGEAQDLFREMGEKGCSPTVVSYTSMIHGLCMSNELDEASKVFDKMGKRGVEPNVITYSSLLDGLCKGGRSMQAMELLERMGRERCQPNMVTYSSLISGLCKEGKIREALEVLDRMRLHGRKPDAGLYGKVIKGLCDLGRFQEAANFLDEMVLGGITPNRVTWSLHVRMHNMVVQGLCTKSDPSRAFQVYLSMNTRGISTEPETFHLLVDCVCKKGEVHRAARIVDEMLLEGCIPDRVIWGSILGAYWGRWKVREAAESIWTELMGECFDSQVAA